MHLRSWASTWEIVMNQSVLFPCEMEQHHSFNHLDFLMDKTCGTEHMETLVKHESWLFYSIKLVSWRPCVLSIDLMDTPSLSDSKDNRSPRIKWKKQAMPFHLIKKEIKAKNRWW